MSDPVIVSGLGRCGTSMVMEMLEAGEYPVAGHPPYYEQPIHVHGMLEGAAGHRLVYDPPEGQAVKILAGSLDRLDLTRSFRFIWMTRDPVAQKASQAKFPEKTWPELKIPLTSFGPDTLVWENSFEDMLAHPFVNAAELAIAVGAGAGVDLDAMAAVVRTDDNRSHVDAGSRCCVAHFVDGKTVPACVLCSQCNGWIRPQLMSDQCPGAPE